MRALTFASLMPGESRAGETVLRELSFASSPYAQVVQDAQRLLKIQFESAPKVLDVFGGGGNNSVRKQPSWVLKFHRSTTIHYPFSFRSRIWNLLKRRCLNAHFQSW